jgi:hypothetical protein
MSLKINRKTQEVEGTMPFEIIHSLGIKCHIPKMTLFKKHSWKIHFFMLLKGITFYLQSKMHG